jgi:ParB family chromosome partitioning protein
LKRGLGRGLSALIPGGEERGLAEVPIGSIGPNPLQPRSEIAQEELAELASSIHEHGILQPLVVTRGEGGPTEYTLIAGERRWRAAQLAGLATVPVIIKEATSRDMLELALVENLQRADLDPLEAATAFRQLMDDFGLTQEQVAVRVGKSRTAVANTLRLLALPAAAKDALASGQISEGHARALLGLRTEEAQTAALLQVLSKALSVRETEALVQRLSGERPTAPAPARREPTPDVQALEERFRQALGTKVNLVRGRKGGRLVIHFYSDDELENLYRRFGGQEL